MKTFAAIGTAVLFVSLAAIVPAFALQEQKEAKQEEKQPQEHAQPQAKQAETAGGPTAAPAQQKEQAANRSSMPSREPAEAAGSPDAAACQAREPAETAGSSDPAARQAREPAKQQAAQTQQHAQQQSRNNQQPAQHTQAQQHAQQAAWRGHESQNWNSDHHTWQQRGGYHGYRIPDNRYNGYFGPNYGFVIYNQPYMVVGGYPRFQYSGFWFSLVDPWPSNWANNWYQTDDVYVVYQNDGYYMYNQRYPGVGIAISVSL